MDDLRTAMARPRSLLLFVAFAIFIGVVIWVANTGQGARYWGFLDAIPFGDKLGHLILMGTLCLLLNLALHCRTIRLAKLPVLFGTLLVSAFVLIEELSQIFLPNRTFDLLDLLADAIGIALASWLAVRISHWQQGSATPGE